MEVSLILVNGWEKIFTKYKAHANELGKKMFLETCPLSPSPE